MQRRSPRLVESRSLPAVALPFAGSFQLSAVRTLLLAQARGEGGVSSVVGTLRGVGGTGEGTIFPYLPYPPKGAAGSRSLVDSHSLQGKSPLFFTGRSARDSHAFWTPNEPTCCYKNLSCVCISGALALRDITFLHYNSVFHADFR